MKFPKGTWILYPLLVALLAVFAVAPLEYPGAFQSHTGLLAVYNLINLDHQGDLGQNPLQFFNWSPTVGRAFDLFRSDGALPYIIAEIFHLIGFGYLDAIKLVYALAWIASGLAMYALARRLVVSEVEPFLSQAAALLAATLYVYLPYHIATVYVRGAFAESVAWAIFPLALLAASRQQQAGSKFDFAAGCLLFAACFLIQPGTAILFALLTFIIVAILHWKEQVHSPFAIRHVLFTIVGGLALGALLYLPAILRHGANVARDGFSPNFVLPFQLFSSLWGFGVSTGNYLDKFPFQLGVAPLGLAILALALAYRENTLPHSHTPTLSHAHTLTLLILLASAVVLTLLTFEITSPLWNVLGVFVAYPWQLLAFVGLALALVAASAIEWDDRLSRPAMLAFFVALPVVASYGYLAPRFLDVTPTRPAIAIFGDNEIALWDYRIVGPLRHGATVRLQLTWQALRPINHDYTIFVHGVHENGGAYAENDSKPQDGALPTIQWTPGQVISDTHTIQFDVDGPREGYHIEFGLYQAATGVRALTETGADVLILPRPGDPEPTISDQLLPQRTP